MDNTAYNSILDAAKKIPNWKEADGRLFFFSDKDVKLNASIKQNPEQVQKISEIIENYSLQDIISIFEKEITQTADIPLNYLTVDIKGSQTLMLTAKTTLVTSAKNEPVTNFATALYDRAPSNINEEIHHQIRTEIISSKANKYDLKHTQNRIINPAVYSKGILWTDSTSSDFQNLTEFLQDYFTLVQSDTFKKQAKEAHQLMHDNISYEAGQPIISKPALDYIVEEFKNK
jgi:hypothetical protein